MDPIKALERSIVRWRVIGLLAPFALAAIAGFLVGWYGNKPLDLNPSFLHTINPAFP